MARKSALDPWRVREEIATAAAKMIAEDGFDFASAKKKAARLVLGESRIAGEWLPDNDQLEEAVRDYQSLFLSDSQPGILRALREIALEWMHRLQAFDPYLTGAVWNGTAGIHSDIHLQLFSDSAKDVAIFLLNAGIEYDVSETRHFAGRDDVETLSFIVRDARLRAAQGDGPGNDGIAGLHLSLYPETNLRGALRNDPRGRPIRGNIKSLTALLSDAAGIGATGIGAAGNGAAGKDGTGKDTVGENAIGNDTVL